MINIDLKEIINRRLEQFKDKSVTFDKEFDNNLYLYNSLGTITALNDISNDLGMEEEKFIKKYDSILAVIKTDYYYITKCKNNIGNILEGYTDEISYFLNLICPLLELNRTKAYKKYNLLLPDYEIYGLTPRDKNIEKRAENYFLYEDGFKRKKEFTRKEKEEYDNTYYDFIENIYKKLLKQIKPEDINI